MKLKVSSQLLDYWQEVRSHFEHISRNNMNRIRRMALTYFPEYKGCCDEELLAVIYTAVNDHDQQKMILNFNRMYPGEDFRAFRDERLLYLKLERASLEKIKPSSRQKAI